MKRSVVVMDNQVLLICICIVLVIAMLTGWLGFIVRVVIVAIVIAVGLEYNSNAETKMIEKNSVIGRGESTKLIEESEDNPVDTFPYKKLFVSTSIDELLNNIRSYKKYLTIRNEKAKGNEIDNVIIEKNKASYAEADIITDLFTEYERVQASVIKNASPMEYWKANQARIISEVGDDHEKQREYIYGHSKEATTFSPLVSAAVYDLLLAKPGVVYDPFGGWGDRMIGAICSDKVTKYFCTDLNDHLANGYEKIKALSNGTVDYQFGDALELAKKQDSGIADVSFTSPPYFNFEKYRKESESVVDYQRWLDEFVRPLVKELFRILKPGGSLAIHISGVSTAPTMLEDFRSICAESGKYKQDIIVRSRIDVPIIVYEK